MLKAAESRNSVGAGAQYNIGRAFYQVKTIVSCNYSASLITGYCYITHLYTSANQ